MDRLWSPWRSQHLATFEQNHLPDGEGSVFARIAAAEDDAEHFVVWRGEHAFVVMNLYPYNNGHLLLVPYRQVADYRELRAEEQAEIAVLIGRAIGWLDAALGPDGYNVGMNQGQAGGAGIPDHLHVHVVPRWRADTNFMPVTGDTKVIPEGLRETYQKLRAAVTASTDDAP
jgi:ATP adenylyltransferase